MDLAKAKSIMIVILAAFNIFLLSTNLSYSDRHGTQRETISNAISILKSRGVELECKIPYIPGKTAKLVYGNGKLDRSAIAREFFGKNSVSGDTGEFENDGKRLVFTGDTEFVFSDGNPGAKVDMGKTGEAGKYVRNYLKDKGLLDGTYILDELTRNQDGSVTARFIEKYYDYLVYDNYCSVTVTDRGITEVEYRKLEIIGFSAAAAKDLAAAYQVLLAHFRGGGSSVAGDEAGGNGTAVSVADASGSEADDNEAGVNGAVAAGSSGMDAVAAGGDGAAVADAGAVVRSASGSGSGAKAAGANAAVVDESGNSVAVGGGYVIITKIDIGYKFAPDQSLNGMESTELLPVWRVRLKDYPKPLYLNTYDTSYF